MVTAFAHTVASPGRSLRASQRGGSDRRLAPPAARRARRFQLVGVVLAAIASYGGVAVIVSSPASATTSGTITGTVEGTSGSPIIDAQGQVVGVLVAGDSIDTIAVPLWQDGVPATSWWGGASPTQLQGWGG